MSGETEQHLARAAELLQVAQEVLDLGHPADSISRSYYAMLHAARAVLSSLGVERSSHHAVWAAFGQFVAARGLMDPRYHREALDAFMARGSSDYEAMPWDTTEDAEDLLVTARDFVGACRAFVSKKP